MSRTYRTVQFTGSNFSSDKTDNTIFDYYRMILYDDIIE